MPKKKTTRSTKKIEKKQSIPVIDETTISETVEEVVDVPKKSKSSVESRAEAAEPSHWHHLKHDRKLHLMLVICSGLAVMTLGVMAAVWLQPARSTGVPAVIANDNAKVSPAVETVEEKPTILPRHLDGLLVAAADANHVPACVMIENAAFDGVRPQSGISAAQVVYEVIVEGGITRWMAVFGGEKADTVGPVRSARDTYLEFASELNCAYVHAGGSFTAMQALQNLGMRDLDGLREYQWFWRDSSKYSPHNLFTSTDKLYEAIGNGHSWNDDPTYAVWNFVDDPKVEGGENATEVNIRFGGSYDVKYVYDTEGQYYDRWNGGVAQTDASTGKTLTARNIIIQKVPPGELLEGKGRINFSVTGEGEVYIFRLGQLTKGTWKKADRLARTQFFTADGEEIPLARGTTWVEIFPETHTFDWL